MQELEAKSFLAGRIVQQAQLEGTPLSDIEQKMLSFSGTGEGIQEAFSAFERDYDAEAYERKIARLIRNHRSSLDRADARSWDEAARALQQGDHYLRVMLTQSRGQVRWWWIWRIVLAVIAGFTAIILLLKML